MNITNVRSFVTVVDAGSFSRAAKELALSQPAVTTQVRSLEEELGQTLLDRQYRNIELTEAGEVFLPHAREILDHIARAQEALQEQVGDIGGHLMVAASSIPGSYIVPRLMGAFAQQHPQVQFDLDISNSTEATDAVLAGRAQLALVGARIKDMPVDYEEIAHDRLTIIAAPTHPLAQKKKITFDDLRNERWIARPPQSGTRQAATATLRKAGNTSFDLKDALILGSDEAIINAVEGELGIAILSKLVTEKALRLGTVAELDLASSCVLERPLYLVTPHRRPTRAAAAFISFIREQMGV